MRHFAVTQRWSISIPQPPARRRRVRASSAQADNISAPCVSPDSRLAHGKRLLSMRKYRLGMCDDHALVNCSFAPRHTPRRREQTVRVFPFRCRQRGQARAVDWIVKYSRLRATGNRLATQVLDGGRESPHDFVTDLRRYPPPVLVRAVPIVPVIQLCGTITVDGYFKHAFHVDRLAVVVRSALRVVVVIEAVE